MTQQELLQMVISLPQPTKEMQFNEDALYDFIVDHVFDGSPYRFEDIHSVITWLENGDSFWPSKQCNGKVKENTAIKRQATKMKHTLKPGTKIKIRKPSANDIKFTDIESAQAYLNQASSNHSNDDSDEVDVTTFDYTTQWNQYPISNESKPKKQQNRKIYRILAENQQQTTASKRINRTSTKTMKQNTCDESEFHCNLCDKKYKQKSSLNRHEKVHLAKEVDDEGVTEPPTPKKRATKGKHSTTTNIPVNTTEPIFT